MKSFFPPAWQIPGLLDGTIGQVSWPIPIIVPEECSVAFTYENGSPTHVYFRVNGRGVGDHKCRVQPGDLLAGKERFGIWSDDIPSTLIVYEADRSAYHDPREMRRAYKTDHVEEWMRVDWNPWDYDCPMAILPANRCPLELCRLHLRVLSIRAQRCVDATEADAIAEGIKPTANCMTIDCDTKDPRERLRALWQPAYARRGLEWEKSWRWVAKVERVNQGKRGNS